MRFHGVSEVCEVCVLDMQGGKAGCHVRTSSVSPTITKGRSSVNDIHVVCRLKPVESGAKR